MLQNLLDFNLDCLQDEVMNYITSPVKTLSLLIPLLQN
jgi:hypothetical protein